MKVAIISGGKIQKEFALSFLETYQPDYIIGVDKGLDFCLDTHLTPDCILGDFDSVKPEVLDEYEKSGRTIERFSVKKDDTDTGLALKKAALLSPKEIYILGGTGSRLDHVLGNLQVLYNTCLEGIPCTLVDANNKITILLPGKHTLCKKKQHGTYVSFLPFTDHVEGLTLVGFAYPLYRHLMTKENSLGISNEYVVEYPEVSFEKGALILIESRD